MKNIFISLLFLLLTTPFFAQQKWMVDNPHSNVRFEVGWEEFSIRTGEFKIFDGSIETESLEDLSNAKVNFVVDATSIDVIAERLANKLKSVDFLHVDEHPEIVFTANGMNKTGDNEYTATGKLTVRGIEKDQEVSVIYKGTKETRKGKIFGIEVNLVVDRTDFGMDWARKKLGDQITLVGHLLYKEKVQN